MKLGVDRRRLGARLQRQENRQADRQADRKTEKQAGKQAGRTLHRQSYIQLKQDSQHFLPAETRSSWPISSGTAPDMAGWNAHKYQQSPAQPASGDGGLQVTDVSQPSHESTNTP